jgi:hypothetical protein
LDQDYESRVLVGERVGARQENKIKKAENQLKQQFAGSERQRRRASVWVCCERGKLKRQSLGALSGRARWRERGREEEEEKKKGKEGKEETGGLGGEIRRKRWGLQEKRTEQAKLGLAAKDAHTISLTSPPKVNTGALAPTCSSLSQTSQAFRGTNTTTSSNPSLDWWF